MKHQRQYNQQADEQLFKTASISTAAGAWATFFIAIVWNGAEICSSVCCCRKDWRLFAIKQQLCYKEITSHQSAVLWHRPALELHWSLEKSYLHATIKKVIIWPVHLPRERGSLTTWHWNTSIYCVIYLSVAGFTINSFFFYCLL